MGGDVVQWNETLIGSSRGQRGDPWNNNIFGVSIMAANFRSDGQSPSAEDGVVGFRIAEVPEPSSFLMLALGALGLFLAARIRRA
jgi:hypothetical protein